MEKLILIISESLKFKKLFIQPYLALYNGDNINKTLERIESERQYDKYDFSTFEIQLLNKLEKLSEKYIGSLISKKKYTRNIKVDDINKHLKEFINNYIEKKNYEIINFIKNKDIDIYHKKQNNIKVTKYDKLTLIAEKYQSVLKYSLNNEGLNLSVFLEKSNKTEPFPQKTNLILCNRPSLIISGDEILEINGIKASRLKIFGSKESIFIPNQSVDDYMKKIVIKDIENTKVITKGFDVEEKSVDVKAEIVLENNIFNSHIVNLYFIYDDIRVDNKVYNLPPKLIYSDNKYKFLKIKRDYDYENKIIALLISLGFGKDKKGYFYNANSKSKYSNIELIGKNINKLKAENIYVKQNVTEKYVIGNPIISKRNMSRINNDWFDVKIEITIDNYIIPFHNLRENIITGNEKFRLPDGSFFIIPQEWFAQYSTFFKNTNKDGDRIRAFHTHLLDDDNEDNEEYNNADFDLSEPNININTSEIKIPEIANNITLRNYQKYGFIWLYSLYKNNYGGILADDMGLGKTIQTVSLLLKIYENNNKPKIRKPLKTPIQLSIFDPIPQAFEDDNSEEPDKNASLIVVPSSLIFNWLSEIKRFAPKLKVFIYAGVKRPKEKDLNHIFSNYNIVLSTYSIIRNDIDVLCNYKFECCILDESQFIKNPKSITYQAITRLQRNFSLAMTGTPIENSILDLWAQMNFVNSGLLNSIKHFYSNYYYPINKDKDENAQNELIKIIKPFVLRRNKNKVATELLPVNYNVVYCEMSKEHKRIYDEVKSAVRNKIFSILEEKKYNKKDYNIAIFNGLSKLRIIANCPSLDNDYKWFKGESNKINLIVENIFSAIENNHKIIIFSSYVMILNLIIKKFEAKQQELLNEEIIHKQIKYSLLHGGTKDREQQVHNFQNDPDTKLFFISLKAGGFGLNLTEADFIFIVNPWWNPATEQNAIDRANRIGQKKQVFVYRYITNNTLEKKIEIINKNKADNAKIFINDDNNNPVNFSKEELEDIFN